ncbi:hypothetical protein [Clostridium phoceensis]|uniref:hypothetical protein n=1 Tax=Clostridium phoceensis TaxID=1650661 RepID=UPI002E797025|nr:hypothetical protein [Clostridium phoceensis]
MKHSIGYLVASIFNFIGGICFLIAAVLQTEPAVAKYGFFAAAICLCVSGAGFLYTHFKEKAKN